MGDGRRLGLPHIRVRPAACIRARTPLIGGIDRSAQYRAELRRLGRLDTFEHDVIGLHEAVEPKVPHSCVARELVYEVGTKRAGPALAGAP
jgi:hypothetical protein